MEKTFIQMVVETAGFSTLISFNANGEMVMDKNPEKLTPLDKADAQEIVKKLRAQGNADVKYRVKAAGQSVRDYQYYVLTEVIPAMEVLDAEAVARIKIEKAPEVSEAPALEEQPATGEVAPESDQPSDAEIDAMIAAKATSKKKNKSKKKD